MEKGGSDSPCFNSDEERHRQEAEAERFRKMQGKLDEPEIKRYSIKEYLGLQPLENPDLEGSTSESEQVE